MNFHDETIVKHNFSNHMACSLFQTVGFSLVTTTLIQDYILVELDLGYDAIGLYNTLGTIVVSLMLFLLPGLADSVKRFSSFTAALLLISLAACCTPLTLLVVHLSGSAFPPLLAFALFLGAYIIFSAVGTGISSSFEPKSMVRLGFSGDGIMRVGHNGPAVRQHLHRGQFCCFCRHRVRIGPLSVAARFCHLLSADWQFV